MNELIKVIIAVIVGAALVLGVQYLPKASDDVQLGYGYNTTVVQGLNIAATTTGSSAGAGPCSGDCPVLVLSPSDYNSYARFENVSDVAIFLHVTSTPLDITGTGADRTATTSLPAAYGDQGIRLEPLGAANEDNVFVVSGDTFMSGLWDATTTAGTADELNVQYN